MQRRRYCESESGNESYSEEEEDCSDHFIRLACPR